MAKINTEIIRKNYQINKVFVPSTYIISTVYTGEDNIHNDFIDTLLINNKSKTFVKNTTFDYDAPSNQTNIDVLNVNQSKLNGTNVQINNTANTFIVNTDNSQSTVDSEQLNTETLFNARNQDQSFFNFPAPTDTQNFVVQPMMISNGQRTIWSEGKYGHINTQNGSVNTLTKFYQSVPHDLNGQTIELTLTDNDLLKNLENYHNGVIILKGSNCSGNVNIQNCSVKLVLSGFTFAHLNISNCNTVYLQDCSFNKVAVTNTMYELTQTINPWQFKRGNLGTVSNYCLSSSNSKIFIKNKVKNLNFNNFFVGIHANNNSQIYMIPQNTTVGILIKQNMSNYNQNKSTRPIFMLASNGSIIKCNYHRQYNHETVNKISASITYPSNLTQAYKGNSTTFVISDNQNYEEGNANYKRVKSLLFSLWSQINNSKVIFSLNSQNDVIDQTEEVSIPLFGLYQVAKPKMTTQTSQWQLPNSQYHIMSGTEFNHISAEGNSEWYLNVYNNGSILSDAQFFTNYNCPSTNNGYEGVSVFPYSPSQPHLAHYFLKQPLEWTTEDITCGIVPNIKTRVFAKQGTKNITQIKNNPTSFKGYINGVQKDIYINPLNNSFYIYNDMNEIQYVTEEVTRCIDYYFGDKDATETVNNFFTSSLSGDNYEEIHNIYYNAKTNNYFYFDKNHNIVSGASLNNEIRSKLYNGKQIQTATPNVPSGNTARFVYIPNSNYAINVVSIRKYNTSSDKWYINGSNTNYTLDNNYYDLLNETFYNKVSIEKIINDKNYFTKTVTIKVGKKTTTTNYDFKYDVLSGEFYYNDNGTPNYNLNNSVKNDLIYTYKKLIDITHLKQRPNTPTLIAPGIQANYISNNGTFKYRKQDANGNWPNTWEYMYSYNRRIVTDAMNPQNTKFYFIEDTINITNIIKHCNQHITTYSRAAGKNVDVYYNKKQNNFYYWVNPTHQQNIVISTFTQTTKEQAEDTEIQIPNQYFCGGMYDITDVVNGEASKFTTYVDGKNRIVFYDFENKEFYYIDDNAQKIVCTDQIDVKEIYNYNSTARTDITTVYTTAANYFWARIPGEGVCSTFWNATSGFYVKKNGQILTGYNMDDPPNSGVIDDYINQTVATFTWKDDNDAELSATYYFETTPVDITPILVNSFKTTIDGKQQTCYYNNDDNTFFYKDEQGTVDVTNTIMKDNTFSITLISGTSTFDLTNIYRYPNYLSIQIGTNYVLFDDSNNILYTSLLSTIASCTTTNEDGDTIWVDGGEESDDISYVMEDYFDVIDGVSACHTYYDSNEQTFKWKKCSVPSGDDEVEKDRGSWADVTTQVVSNLTWYYDGTDIANIINGGATFEADVDGQTKVVKFNPANKRFLEAETDIDVTYFITGALNVYYNQTDDITNILYNPAFFTFNINKKPRDIYYSPFLNNGAGSFYLNKKDISDQLSSLITCKYKNKDITNAFKTTTTFSGVYVDDNNDYITSEKITYNGQGWENDILVDGEPTTDDITDNIEAKITSQKLFQVKYNFQNVIDTSTKYFEGIVSTFNTSNELIDENKRKLYWDKTASKLYYPDEENKEQINTQLLNFITYKYNNNTIDDNVIHGNATFNAYVMSDTVYTAVGFDREQNIFYYMDGTQKVDITDLILEKFQVIFEGTINIDLTSIRFGDNSDQSIPIAGKDVHYRILNNEDNFYYVDGITQVTYNEIRSQLFYYYKGWNINDIIYQVQNAYFEQWINDKTVHVHYKKQNNKDFFYYDQNGAEVDVTDIIRPLVQCNYICENNNDVTFLFNDENQSANLGNFQNVHFNPLNGYYVNNQKVYIDNITRKVNYTGDNGQFFYYEDIQITNIINGNSFPFEVLREIYYDNKYSMYKYTNSLGQNVDVSDSITPYIQDKYFYKRKKKTYEDISNVIYNGQWFNANWKPTERMYFDYAKCKNMAVSAKALETDFGQCFYYVGPYGRVYDNANNFTSNVGKHVQSACFLSTYYYGNLLDISDNMLRQPFSTYIRLLNKNLQVYYDTYGGKKKNLGCYYTYNAAGAATQITDKVSAAVRQKYYYNGMNITDTVMGSHFNYNTKMMYFDQLTGRYYYLYGNLHKIPASGKADKYNYKLAYDYTGKLDLTKMRQTGSTISAFWSFLNGDRSTEKKFTFKINKNNELKWIKQGSTNVTSTMLTSYINGHYYLDNPDIKFVTFGSKWFFTPIDGVTRRVYYRKWKKKFGKFDYYYVCNKKKIFCTEKIMSHINFYHDGDDINSMIRGASFKTAFEGTVLDGPTRKVFYDRYNNEYYYEEKEYLTTDYVAANIWVDITNAQTYPKKWCFLAWYDGKARQVYYDKKNLSYFYKDGKTNVNVANSEIENSNNIFTNNGDDRNYYHNQKLSTYMLWDNYLKVMVGDHIIDVYKNTDPKREEGQDYYYVTKRVKVNHIIQNRVTKKYVYQGQTITNVIYPNPYSTINLDETAYKNKFTASVLTGNATTYYNKNIFYHPSAGFHHAGSVILNKNWPSYQKRIVNDQICPMLNYFYYDRQNNIQYDISHNIDTKIPFTIPSGDGTIDVYNQIPENQKYVWLCPSTHIRNNKTNDIRRLHKRRFYILDQNNNQVDITKDIIPNLEIRFGQLDITKTVEDGHNYFLNSVGGFKRFMYYNPKIKTWYYYKTNKFARDLTINAKISGNFVPSGAPQYFCYTQNITSIKADTTNKKTFLGTTEEDVFYDFNSKAFYYYTNKAQTEKEIVTQYIEPYITKEYVYEIEGECYDNISDVIKGKSDTFIARIGGEERLVRYDRNTGNFTYVYSSVGNWNMNILLTPLHNTVEMVCSNNKGSKYPEIASKIEDSKLYQNIYKMKV